MVNEVPYLSFYNHIGHAPTRQQNSTIDTLQARRAFLYRTLGIPSFAVRGADIIEFGPGSGENADTITALSPRNYKFVDGSNAVLTKLKERIISTSSGTVGPQFTFSTSNILDYQDDTLYDLVICEGVLPMQMKPREMANHVLSFVRPGGVAVLTCMDPVSSFSEIARRYVASWVFGNLEYSEELVRDVVDFFTPDFAYLPGMSRQPEDWVLDSIIHPWMGEFFTIQDALEVAKDGYALLGTSPRILQDWRWYKDLSALDENTTLTSAVSSYRKNMHSLIDVRFVSESHLDDEDNTQLIYITSQIATRVRDHIIGAKSYEVTQFGGDIQKLLEVKGQLDPQTVQSLQALLDWSVTRDVSDLSAFRSMWGRGQQYISLTRLG